MSEKREAEFAPEVGDTVMVAGADDAERQVRITRVHGQQGDVGAPPDSYMVELADGSMCWAVMRDIKFANGSRRATWDVAKHIR